MSRKRTSSSRSNRFTYPPREKEKTAFVGSSIPFSSAVWEPIEEGRYLAFLTSSREHFRYDFKIQLRKVDDDNKVFWHEKNKDDKYFFSRIKLEDATKTICEMIPECRQRQAAKEE